MKLSSNSAISYVPGGGDVSKALKSCTHMSIGAHPDDIEIMSFHGIKQCYRKNSFVGVVACDGAGSARSGAYSKITDKQMIVIRQEEQKKAADLGKYGALVMLNHTSSAVKDVKNKLVTEDLVHLFQSAKPKTVYLHNLADKHETHVALTLKCLLALRRLPKAQRPKKIYGCEVWRSLDWLSDKSKVALSTSGNVKLAMKLCQVHRSQVQGGKRYDLGTLGRRSANATFFESTKADVESGLSFAMDLTPLMNARVFSPKAFIKKHLLVLEKEIFQFLKTASK